MESSEGRSPRPRRGDPNVKNVRLALTPEEWRKLRLWAAEDSTSIEAIVRRTVERELVGRPRHDKA
jgi:hypothetical protein